MQEPSEGLTNRDASPGIGRLALPGVVGFLAVFLATYLTDRVNLTWLGYACKILYPCLGLAAAIYAVIAIRRYSSSSPRSRGFMTFLVLVVNLSFAAAAFFLMRILLFGSA